MKRTAITRRAPSKPMQYLYSLAYLTHENDHWGRTLDYGSGRGFDADYFNMERYDPNFAPEKPSKGFDVITCNYVLNVVDKVTQRAIVDEIEALLNDGGIAFISVRRDLKKDMHYKDYSQTIVTLTGKWKLFKEVSGSYIMYYYRKDQLKSRGGK